MNVPNAISLARLATAPVAVWLILEGLDSWALAVFVAAGLSDAADGLIAKLTGRVTTLGAYLDPLADKALLVGTYASLGARGALPLWLVILVISRDVLILGGALLEHILTHRSRPDPMVISKVNTVAQIALAAAVLGSLALGGVPALAQTILLWLVAVTTGASGLAYVIRWAERLRDEERTRA